MRIEIISGSSREHSLTRRVAIFLKETIATGTDHEINILDVRQYDFPLLESVIMNPEKAPEGLFELAERMFQADAFILVSPEYNGSFSAAMKNLLDHFPKQNHKPFGIVTASPGALGGIRAAIQLQQLVFALFGIGSPFMLVIPQVDQKFSIEGKLIDPAFEKSTETFINEFLWLAESIVKEHAPVIV